MEASADNGLVCALMLLLRFDTDVLCSCLGCVSLSESAALGYLLLLTKGLSLPFVRIKMAFA